MKKIKVFARKLSLFLMAAALVFVALPSNFVFAEDYEEIRVCGYCPPDSSRRFIRIEKRVDGELDDSDLEFAFRIKSYFIGGDANSHPFDFSNYFGEPVDENTYEFKLKSGEDIWFRFSGYFSYEIWEVGRDGWELTDINDDSGRRIISGGYNDDSAEFHEYIFTNRKVAEEEVLLDENITENQTEESINDEPSLAVPNTGENTGGFSATRTGIVAFAVVVTLGRVAYLIRKYKR